MKELSGRAIPSKSMYISSTNQRQNINPNEFQLFMSSQKNQKNNMSNSSIKNKLNQSVNDGFGYNFHGFSNMYCNSNNPNQSMTIDNEIEELYEQEDENNVFNFLFFFSQFNNFREKSSIIINVP